MKPIIWRNEKFVVFASDENGQYEARLIEHFNDAELEKHVGFSVWFKDLESAIGFAKQSSTTIEQKESDLWTR